MKNKSTVKLMTVLFMCLFTVFVTTGCSCSCTSSMCSEADENNIKKQIEKNNIEGWRNTFSLSGQKTEHDDYIAYANAKVEEIYIETDCGKSGTCTTEEIANVKNSIKRANNNAWLNELEELSPSDDGYVKTRTDNFQQYVNEEVNKLYETHPKACLVVTDDIDPQTGAKIEAKSWGDAWKTGLLEGLIVYPLAWLLSALTGLFGGGGVAQLFAILVTVIIIRALMLILNFKGQISTIKMQSIQGEVSKLSAKLQDPNISQQEKQALSMKMMDIYRSNDIHPFATLLTQFISFPIFIAVWAAMNQTLAIRKGSLFGMEFGSAVNSQIFSGNIAAIILFALMIAGQVVSMRISMWIKVAKEKKKNPHYKKPEKTDTEKQMNVMLFVMMGLVVMSGFILPAALVMYWFFGSVVSILQTWAFSTEFVNSKLKSLANRKKKAKVVR